MTPREVIALHDCRVWCKDTGFAPCSDTCDNDWHCAATLRADAILAVLRKAGFAVVPREPTGDMMEAGERTFVPTRTGTPTSTPLHVWRAMLAAAEDAP